MSRKPGDVDKFRVIQGLTHKALKAIGETLDSGSEQGKLAAAKIVLDRTMPVPKTSPAAVAAAAALGAAGGAHLAALAAKAAERLNIPADTAQTVQLTSQPVFAPLHRVQND